MRKSPFTNHSNAGFLFSMLSPVLGGWESKLLFTHSHLKGLGKTCYSSQFRLVDRMHLDYREQLRVHTALGHLGLLGDDLEGSADKSRRRRVDAAGREENEC